MVPHVERDTTQTDTTLEAGPSAVANPSTRPSPDSERGSGPNPPSEEPPDPCYNVKFDALRTALYHGSREQWYASLHRWVMFVNIMAGTAAVAAFFNAARSGILPEVFIKYGPLFAPVLITVITTLDLVFDLSGKARQHARLKEQFFEVLADCEADTAGTPHVHRAKLTRIYGQEPPLKHALNDLMWNKAYLALSRKQDLNELKQINFWGRRTRQLFSHEEKDYSSVNDRKRRDQGERDGEKISEKGC